MMSGTITLSNGKTVKATKWDNGAITWEQTKMTRHGIGTGVSGMVQRNATDKQASTFVPDVVAPVFKISDSENVRHMANFAVTASARRFWARKAGLVDAVLAAL